VAIELAFWKSRGETEETMGHLKANFRAERIAVKKSWPLRNRHVVIARMLSPLLRR